MRYGPCLWLMGWLASTGAWAGPDQERFPVLVHEAEAAYPRKALERGIEGAVLLQIDVSEYGTVNAVEVLESGGHGFDEVAVQAARSFLFEPALNERGKPTSARIEYRLVFDMDHIAPLSVSGDVRERGSRKYVAGAVVEAVGPDGQIQRAPTDDSGHFRLAGLEPGTWNLIVHGNGLATATASVVVPEGDYLEGVLLWVERLATDWGDDEAGEIIEVVGRISAAEVTAYTLDKDTIIHLPGSLGDPVRAIQNLPGIARAPFGSGQLLVRGTGPEDTGFYLDGLRLPLVFHFAGLSTVVNADVLSEISFLPGNFSARYGNALGGVVDLKIDDELPTKAHTYASFDIFQSAAFTSQRLGPNTALMLSARRSYIDAVLNPILQNTEAAAFRTPRYYDAQVRLYRRLRGRGRLGAMFMLSDDRFRVLGESTSPHDDLIGYSASFQKLRIRWYQPMGRGWTNTFAGIFGPEVRKLELSNSEVVLASDSEEVEGLTSALPSDGLAMEQNQLASLRNEVVRPPGAGWLGLRAGAELTTGKTTIVDDFNDDLDVQTNLTQLAAYSEPTVRLGPLDLTPGLRISALSVDGFGEPAMIDPRFSTRLDLGTTVFSAGIGRYSQLPANRELLDAATGVLGPERAIHAALGVEQRLGSVFTASATGYHHWLADLVVGRDNAFRFDDTSTAVPRDTEPFANAGAGRLYGLETQLTAETDHTTAWLAATFGRSSRVDREGVEAPATYEQPVLLTAIGTQALPRQWRIGGRARYASGPPMTGVENAIFSLDDAAWIPVEGGYREERIAPFFALDVRLDKTWTFRQWALTSYLDVQNTTNRKNVEIPGWSPDYSEYNPIYGLPILPAIGFRGAW